MKIRKPIVAGQFYPGQHNACVDEINNCIEAETISSPLPQNIVGAIVPHAGWTFSGSLAALVFTAIKQQHEKVHTFVLFGAAHRFFGDMPAVWDEGFWETPLGQIAIDEDLSIEIIKQTSAVSNCEAHRSEHSIEVQIPFIQYLFPGAKILPVMVQSNENSIILGQKIGQIIDKQKPKKIVCIGSTDLTHYGPRYGFAPEGTGKDGLYWAHNVNDVNFLNTALQLEPKKLLINAAENLNACGPGAVAATIAAARELGSEQGILLKHTNSNEVLLEKTGSTSTDSVGYAAIVF